jgi:O-antigen ligase/tetratricopeptide (TPR) repeat protein
MKNNQNIAQEKIHRLFFWGVLIILFLPIAILPPGFQPSDWSRTALFRIILTILISFFLFKFFYKKDISISVPAKKSLAYLPAIVLAALFLILVLSTIFSQDIRFSIFGSPARAGGILDFLFYLIFAVILGIFIKGDDWEKLWNAAFIAGAVASLLAIVQYFNLFKAVFVAYEGGGTPSFLGNSTLLAIYMLFLALFSFTLFSQAKSKNKKLVYFGLFLLFSFTILVTGSRASYLAIVISLFFFFLFYPKKFKTLKIAAVFIMVSAFLIILLFNLFPQQLAKNDILSTISNRLSLKTVAKDLFGTRFSAWKITLEAVKDKPILGWGPENFYIGFEKHYDPTIPDFRGLWWDRPHNVFLEMLASSGLFALMLYVAFWIVLLWQLQRFKRKQGDNRETYLAHGLQAIFLGYLVVLFFNFDSFSTYLISFFFIGYAFYLLSGQEKIEIIPNQKSFFGKKIILGFCLIAISLFLWFWNIKPIYLGEQINRANTLTNNKKCDQSIKIMSGVWKNGGILKPYAVLRYSDFLKTCASLQPDKEIDYASRGLEALKQASLSQPKYTRTWLLMGSFANVLAAREQNQENKNKLLSDAINYLEKAKKISPGRQEIVIEMEKNYLIAKNYEAMKKITDGCIKINPDRGECYWYLGIAEIFLGDQTNGKIHIKKAEEKTNVTFPYIQLAVAYLSQNNYTDAIYAYEKVIFYDSGNAGYHAALAFLYREVGEYSKAGREARRVFELQPDNKDAMEFIQALLGSSPNDPTLHGSLAFIYMETGEEGKAKQELLTAASLYKSLISAHPNTADYHYNLALVYKELGIFDGAQYENAYKEAIVAQRIDPINFDKRVSGLIQKLPTDYWGRYQHESF